MASAAPATATTAALPSDGSSTAPASGTGTETGGAQGIVSAAVKAAGLGDVTFKYTKTAVRYKDDTQRPADVKAVCRELMEGWAAAKDEEMEIVVISGGITNLLYRVDYQGKSGLVRVFGEKTEVLIDRDVDNRVFQCLSDSKFGPFLHGVFGNGRVEGWVDAAPLTPEQMGQSSPTNFPKLIAQGLGSMHNLDMPGAKAPMLWTFLDKWYKMACDVTFPAGSAKAESLAKLGLPKLAEEVKFIQTILPSPENKLGADLQTHASSPVDRAVTALLREIVFSHNDLLSGNILKFNSEEKLQIVDFEYGGWNFRGFDLANHFCEYAGFDFDLDKWYPKRPAQELFFRPYLATVKGASWVADTCAAASCTEEELFDAMYARVNQFALASHFFWGLWAIIQARYSPIDFDFLQYGHDRFGGYFKHKAAFVSSSSS